VVCGSAEVHRAKGEEEAETVVYAAAVAVAWSGGAAVAAELGKPPMASVRSARGVAWSETSASQRE
jgi:hypothetical protein